MKVLMYSPDSIGLGHMRRNSSIASELVRLQPGMSVALLIGSGAGAFFSVPRGIDTIKLPSIQKVAADRWEARSLNLTAQETSSLRAGIIRNVISTLRPDVFLVDHMPMGVCGDLVPALQTIKHRRMSTRTVLGLRDILDEPETIRKRWAAHGQYDFIAEHFDHVLIYGDESVYPSAKHYGLIDCCPGGVEYVGYVCSAVDSGRDTRGDAAAVAGLNGLNGATPDQRIIVAAGGGGHDAFPMLSAVIGGLKRLDHDATIRSVVVAGPLMPEEDRSKLVEQAAGLMRTTVLPWTSDLMDYLAAADVSVVMAGYNSSLEALSTRSRVIMAPRPGPSAEQRMRADMLARKGHVTCIPPEALSPETMTDALRAALREPSRTPASDLLSGGAAAARSLVRMCARQPIRAVPAAASQVSPYVIF